MANDTYVLFSYTIQDRFGTKTTTVVPGFVDGAAITATNLHTEWTTLGTDLDAVIDAQIIGGRVNIEFPADGGWKSSPGADSFDERTGVLNFNNATTKYKYGIKVPSWANSKLSSGKINLSDTEVSALITLLTTAFTHGEFANPGLYAFTALADAFLAARKYRKQLDKSTYEPG